MLKKFKLFSTFAILSLGLFACNNELTSESLSSQSSNSLQTSSSTPSSTSTPTSSSTPSSTSTSTSSSTPSSTSTSTSSSTPSSTSTPSSSETPEITPNDIEIIVDSNLLSTDDEVDVAGETVSITKYILKTNSQTTLEVNLLPGDSVGVVEYTVEAGKEKYLEVTNEGVVSSLDKSYLRVKVTVSVKDLDLSKDVYFEILDDSAYYYQEVLSFEENTKNASEQSAVKEEAIYTSKSGSVRTTTAEIYLDELHETQINEPSSSSDYYRVRKIENDVYYQVKYDKDKTNVTDFTSVNLTNDNRNEYEIATNGVYLNSVYGFYNILFDANNGFLTKYLSNQNLTVTKDNNVYTLTSNYSESSGYFDNYYSNVITLTVDNNVIISAKLETKQYYDDPSDPENVDITPTTSDQYEAKMTLGTKTNVSNPLDISSLYYSSFTVSFNSESFYVGDSYSFTITSSTPNTASNKVDTIKIVSVEDVEGENVLQINNSADGFKVNAKGKATITIASKNFTLPIEITTQYKAITSLEVNPSTTSTTLKPGQNVNFKANVYPTKGIETGKVTATITDGIEYAELTCNNETNQDDYTLHIKDNAVDKATVTVKFTTVALNSNNEPFTQSFTYTINVPVVDSTLDAALKEWLVASDFTLNTDVSYDYGMLSFNDDGTGFLIEYFDDVDLSFNWDVLGGEIQISDVEDNYNSYYTNDITSMELVDNNIIRVNIVNSYSSDETSTLEYITETPFEGNTSGGSDEEINPEDKKIIDYLVSSIWDDYSGGTLIFNENGTAEVTVYWYSFTFEWVVQDGELIISSYHDVDEMDTTLELSEFVLSSNPDETYITFVADDFSESTFYTDNIFE